MRKYETRSRREIKKEANPIRRFPMDRPSQHGDLIRFLPDYVRSQMSRDGRRTERFLHRIGHEVDL